MENRKSVIAREREKAHTGSRCSFTCSPGRRSLAHYIELVLLNNVEQKHKRLNSGDKYEIRKRFLNHGFDLEEDGWKQVKVRRDDPELAPHA
jgi:hypothetical protein